MTRVLFVFGGELPAPFLLGQVEVAEILAPMTDRRSQKSRHWWVVFRESRLIWGGWRCPGVSAALEPR